MAGSDGRPTVHRTDDVWSGNPGAAMSAVSVRQRQPVSDHAGAGAADAIDPQERIDALLVHLGTQLDGLSSREVERRLAQHGPNEISRTAERSRMAELARQLAHPLALLLWVAA